MNTNGSRRGRPPTFDWETRRSLAELIRQHGARGAQQLTTIRISLGTLLEIAREFEIPLKKGRRKRAA